MLPVAWFFIYKFYIGVFFNSLWTYPVHSILNSGKDEVTGNGHQSSQNGAVGPNESELPPWNSSEMWL